MIPGDWLLRTAPLIISRVARFLFVTWSGGGNVHPLAALGSQLASRGHEVRVVGPAELTPRFEVGAMSFVAQKTHWTAGNPMYWPDSTPEKLDVSLRASFDEVAREIERAPTDVLVVDFMQPDALCAAERSGLPFVGFVHTLYGPGPQQRSWPMEMRTDLAALNRLRTDVGLPSVDLTADVLDSASSVIVVTIPELDDPQTPLPENVRYVGPILEAPGAETGWSPPAGGAPLIVVGMGTTAMGESDVLQRAFDAVEGLDVTAFVTLGEHLDAGSFRVPPNAIVSGYVRHTAVMPHASLFVGHAGLGGISAALAHGVPMVCVPLGRDQPMNAARVEAVGAGVTVPPDADVSTMRSAISSVLADPRYRAGAERVADAIASYGNGAVAVEELERLV